MGNFEDKLANLSTQHMTLDQWLGPNKKILYSVEPLSTRQAAAEMAQKQRTNLVEWLLKLRDLQQQQEQNEAQRDYWNASIRAKLAGIRASSANAGTIKKTQKQLQDEATANLLQAARNRYRDNLTQGATERQAGGKISGAGARPLYYTINSLLRDPKFVDAFIVQGADPKLVVDQFITEKTGKQPSTYFAGGGANLLPSYQSLTQTKDSIDDLYAQLGTGGDM